MVDTFTPPATPGECRKQTDIHLRQARDLVLGGERDRSRAALDLVDQYLHYGKTTWPDEFDERTFARVTKAEDANFGRVGQVGNWSHNCGDLHFPDGTIKDYYDWDLERVKSSEAIRADFPMKVSS